MSDSIDAYRAQRDRGSRTYGDEIAGPGPPELRKLLDSDRLYHALSEAAAGPAQAAGPSGVRPRDLSRHERGEIARLASEHAMKGGCIRSRTRQHRIPRPGKTPRVISIADPHDRAIGARLGSALGRWADPLMCDGSYAWRPCRDGLSMLAALAHRIENGQTWFLQDDIRGMFDHADVERTILTLRRVFTNRPKLARFLEDFVRGHPAERTATGVRQGCGASPLAMNLLRDELLAPLIEERPDVSVFVYGDDIALAGATSESVVFVRKRAAALLAEAGFSLKGEQAVPLNLSRHSGRAPVLLGFSLRVIDGRLVLAIPVDAWKCLSNALAAAARSDDPAESRCSIAVGWTTNYAAAVDDTPQFIRRFRRAARRAGVRELDIAKIQQALTAGQERWRRLLAEP